MSLPEDFISSAANGTGEYLPVRIRKAGTGELYPKLSPAPDTHWTPGTSLLLNVFTCVFFLPARPFHSGHARYEQWAWDKHLGDKTPLLDKGWEQICKELTWPLSALLPHVCLGHNTSTEFSSISCFAEDTRVWRVRRGGETKKRNA